MPTRKHAKPVNSRNKMAKQKSVTEEDLQEALEGYLKAQVTILKGKATRGKKAAEKLPDPATEGTEKHQEWVEAQKARIDAVYDAIGTVSDMLAASLQTYLDSTHEWAQQPDPAADTQDTIEALCRSMVLVPGWIDHIMQQEDQQAAQLAMAGFQTKMGGPILSITTEQLGPDNEWTQKTVKVMAQVNEVIQMLPALKDPATPVSQLAQAMNKIQEVKQAISLTYDGIAAESTLPSSTIVV